MDRFLIIGLGNPGREYERTRHNIGFRVLDSIARTHGMSFSKKQARALVAEGVIADRRVMLVKPQTYMNLSGEAVGSLIAFYKLPLSALMVIHDDMDLPLGTLRIRAAGSAGGQNGMRSIIAHLGSQQFARMRFGIGRPPGRMDPAAYVLQDFDQADAILLDETLARVGKAIETWLRFGIELAMTRHNGTNEQAARKIRAEASPDPTQGTADSGLVQARVSPDLPQTAPEIPSDNGGHATPDR